MTILLLLFILNFVLTLNDFSFGGGVVVLETSTFKKRVKKEPYMLVLFYEFSPYSQQAVPVMKSIVKKVKKDLETPILVAAVNCQNDRTVCKEYNVKVSQGSTLKLFKDGEDYRTYGKEVGNPEAVFEWIRLLTRKSINHITSLGELKELMREFSGMTFLFCIHHHANYPSDHLLPLSNFLNEIIVVVVDKSLASSKLLKKLRIKKSELEIYSSHIFMLYRFWKKSYKRLKASKLPQDEEKLAKEIFEFGFPPVSEVNELSLMRMGNVGGSVNCILFFDFEEFDDENSRKKLLEATEIVAVKKLGKVSFGYADSNDDYFRIYTNIGGNEDELPNIGCIDLKKQTRFIYSSDLYSEEDIEVFVDRILSGKIKQKMKSEKFPSQNEPVYKIVAQTYEEVVHKNNNHKDIVILFHGASAASEMQVKGKGEEAYEKVAIHYQGDTDRVLVGKFDVTKNDIVDKNVVISGIPMIVMYQKGNRRNPIVFNGDIQDEDVIKFIEKNTVALRLLDEEDEL